MAVLFLLRCVTVLLLGILQLGWAEPVFASGETQEIRVLLTVVDGSEPVPRTLRHYENAGVTNVAWTNVGSSGVEGDVVSGPEGPPTRRRTPRAGRGGQRVSREQHGCRNDPLTVVADVGSTADAPLHGEIASRCFHARTNASISSSSGCWRQRTASSGICTQG